MLRSFLNGRKINNGSGKSKEQRVRRGLDALFADQAPVVEPEKEVVAEKPVEGNSVIYIDINNIKPNENQPRKVFDEEKIAELSASIIEHGIIRFSC